jgi:Contractile injection system tube protein
MTAPVTKAVLEALDKAGKVTETVPVQFNPTSLKLSMSNSTDGGKSRGRQVQQYNGSSSTSLSVELAFDTADEGTTEEPVDVRTRIEGVTKFVLPGGEGSKQAPPRVQFHWGTLIVAGVMTSLSETLDLFSPQGVPLRATVGVEIKEQDAKFEALERGAGANQDRGAQPAGQPGGGSGPGTAGSGGGPDARTAEALDGESAADFLARNGLDPAAWRAVAGVLGDVLSLAGGTAIDFSASLSVEAGIGISVGFEAGLDLSLGASLGLETGLETGAGADLSAGFALAAAGGVTAAGQVAAATQAEAEAGRAKAAFGLAAPPSASPAAAAAGAPAPDAARAPLAATPSARTLQPAPAARQPPPPRADGRAVTFGRGVPLRDRVSLPAVEAGTGGYVVVEPRAPSPLGPPRTSGSGRAPWEQLPASPGSAGADREQHRRAPTCGCRSCRP